MVKCTLLLASTMMLASLIQIEAAAEAIAGKRDISEQHSARALDGPQDMERN